MQNALTAQIAIDAAEQRATYYQQLAQELEDEILSVRTELFASRVEYEARIERLEAQLSAALAGLSSSGNNGTNTGNSGTGGNTNNGGSSTTPSQGTQKEDPDEEPVEDPYADFQFRITDGKATLTAYVGSKTRVEVPSTYQGCPVTAIADRAFENKTRLQSVTLPSGIETIGWFAFSGCVALHEVAIPASVKSISYGAFLNCSSALVISCQKDSYAEKYAQSYGIETKR